MKEKNEATGQGAGSEAGKKAFTPEVFHANESKMNAAIEVLEDLAKIGNEVLEFHREQGLGEMTKEEFLAFFHHGPDFEHSAGEGKKEKLGIIPKIRKASEDEMTKFQKQFKHLKVQVEVKDYFQLTGQLQAKNNNLKAVLMRSGNSLGFGALDLQVKVEWLSVKDGKVVIDSDTEKQVREFYTYKFETPDQKEAFDAVQDLCDAFNRVQGFMGDRPVTASLIGLDGLMFTGEGKYKPNLDFFAMHFRELMQARQAVEN